MRHVMEASTDASSLLLFDPGALPASFDRDFQTGFVEILETLNRQGKLCWIAAEGDGKYLLHAYIGERVPESWNDVRSRQLRIMTSPYLLAGLFLRGRNARFAMTTAFSATIRTWEARFG